MKGILTLPIRVPAAQRPDCLQCGRPYGRVRRLKVGEHPVLEVDFCDQCWRLVGGTTAVTAKLESLASDVDGDIEAVLEQLVEQPLFVMDPAAEEMMFSAEEYDHLHPADRILMSVGIRWALLRTIVPAARADLALKVTDRTPPPDTRPADAATLWMEALEQRMREAKGFRYSIGAEFKYVPKLHRWWYIARTWAMYAQTSGRPLSCVTQAEVAAIVGCSTRTVGRCVAWLRSEGLFWEVVPGCQLPMMATPEGTTQAEQAERARALAEATAAEEAARQRARAQVAAVRSGLRGDAAVQAGQDAAASALPDPQATEEDQEVPLVNIAPVYELRVPWTAAEQADARLVAAAAAVRLSEGEKLLLAHKASLVAGHNRHLYHDKRKVVTVIHRNGAHHCGYGDRLLTDAGTFSAATCHECGPVIGLLRGDPWKMAGDLHKHEIVHPPVGGSTQEMISSTDGVVDKGRAARGIDRSGFLVSKTGPDLPVGAQTADPRSDSPSRPVSEPVRLARRLKHSRLDLRVTVGVSVSRLAREIARSGLLAHGWTEDDLVDTLHGLPEFRLLPMEIRNPGGWIHARLSQANPHLSPTKLRIIDEIERSSALLQQRAADEHRDARHAEAEARRAAIENCPLCDEGGWLDTPPPVPRCNHDPLTGGW